MASDGAELAGQALSSTLAQEGPQWDWAVQYQTVVPFPRWPCGLLARVAKASAFYTLCKTATGRCVSVKEGSLTDLFFRIILRRKHEA
jgi:hypothetical protein